MSLRARLLALMVLTAVALAAAGTLIFHALATTRSAREGAARRQAVDLSRALALSGAGALQPNALGAKLNAVLAGTLDVDGGFCRRSGAVLISGGTDPEGRLHPAGHPLPPDLREVVATACAGTEGRVEQRRHPRDVAVVSTTMMGDDLRAFVIARAPQALPGENPPPLVVGVLVLATVGLAVVALEALFVLRRGSLDLETVLAGLPERLSAPRVRPRALELSRIVDQLDSMALRLSEARTRERELERTLSHEQRLASLGRMAAGVAHEIRNPLSGLKLRLDLLARTDGLTPQMLRDLVVCQDEIVRLNRVVETMLQVSRKNLVSTGVVPLRPLVESRVTQLLLPLVGHVPAPVVEGDAVARADPDATSRIVDNLVRNALEAGTRAPITLRISSAEGRACLEVEDDGPGIPPERLGELFEPFFTLRTGGTGLGLWLSRSLAQAQGGTLEYERRAGRTLFRLSLPPGGP